MIIVIIFIYGLILIYCPKIKMDACRLNWKVNSCFKLIKSYILLTKHMGHTWRIFALACSDQRIGLYRSIIQTVKKLLFQWRPKELGSEEFYSCITETLSGPLLKKYWFSPKKNFNCFPQLPTMFFFLFLGTEMQLRNTNELKKWKWVRVNNSTWTNNLGQSESCYIVIRVHLYGV